MLSSPTALLLALGLGLAPAAAEAPAAEAEASPAATEESAAATTPGAPARAGEGTAKATIGPDDALDLILPCGLRVLIARDRTLPVAAVILAIESGPEDDPAEHPGLNHALAYYLLQGNRELRPGETVDTVHSGGGVSNLAIGHAQVRFESVIPASRLAEVLWLESQRLRFPTIRENSWKQALGWSMGDFPRPSLLGPAAVAAIHRVPGLGHEERRAGPSLSTLSAGAIASALRSRFEYPRATLVVVAPDEPAAIAAMIEPLFADLPATRRRATNRLPGVRTTPAAPAPALAPAPAPAAEGAGAEPAATASPKGQDPKDVSEETGAKSPSAGAGEPADAADAAEGAPQPGAGEPAPEVVPLGTHKLPVVAWPIPATPAANAWASALCRALNRQRRRGEEPKKIRVSCAVDSDPRRGTLLVQVAGVDDPLATLRERLARLAESDRGILRGQASAVAGELRYGRHRPLELARQLAAAAVDDAADPRRVQALDELTGVAELTDVDALDRVFPAARRLAEAIVLVRPAEGSKGKPITPTSTPKAIKPEGDDGASEEASE